MVFGKQQVEWYKHWFNSDYRHLYPNRDSREARDQVEFLLRKMPFSAGMRVLDSACGTGRHLKCLLKKTPRALGFDLSPFQLKQARDDGLPVFRADMRRIPLKDSGFDLVTSFFSSFGYFSTAREDSLVLDEFSRLLRIGGWLFLDLANAAYVKANLKPRSIEFREGKTFTQSRRLMENIVEKEIKISGGPEGFRCFHERLRLYTPKQMEELCKSRSLKIRSWFGDEKGSPFLMETSPRMALLIQKTAR